MYTVATRGLSKSLAIRFLHFKMAFCLQWNKLQLYILKSFDLNTLVTCEKMYNLINIFLVLCFYTVKSK